MRAPLQVNVPSHLAKVSARARRTPTPVMTVTMGDYRVVDLSLRLVPGQEERRLELRRGILETDQSFYHDIDTMSHVGTHVETPLHFYGEGHGVAELPLETFLGEALLLDLSALPGDADATPEALLAAGADDLSPGDIAVVTAGGSPDRVVHLTPAASVLLAKKRIRMLGFDDSIGLGRDGATQRAVHDPLMRMDVPFLERLTNLQALPEPRFLLIALPWRVAGLDSSPVRAIALVPAG